MKTYARISALLGWLAVILQLYLMLQNRVVSIPETLLRFFMFFTILTNILVATCYTVIAWERGTSMKAFLAKPATLTAVTVYILVVGAVYNVLLRFLWEPKGLQMVVDEILHTVQPILFFIFWWLFVPKEKIKWKTAFQWLLYPAAYMLYIIFLSALIDFYPYPFADVNKLGYMRVLINAGGILFVFMALSMLLITVTNFKMRRKKV